MEVRDWKRSSGIESYLARTSHGAPSLCDGAGLRRAPDPPQRHEAEFSKRTSLVKSGVLENTQYIIKEPQRLRQKDCHVFEARPGHIVPEL